MRGSEQPESCCLGGAWTRSRGEDSQRQGGVGVFETKQGCGEKVTMGNRVGLRKNPETASLLCLEALKEGGNKT